MSHEFSLGSDAFIPALLPEARLEADAVVLEIEGTPRRAEFRRLGDGLFLLNLDGRMLRCFVSTDASGTWVTVEGRLVRLRTSSTVVGSAGGSLVAPMPGRVVRLCVKEGAEVEAGAELLRLEAMKMEHAVKAPRQGKVKAFLVKEGEQVQGGRLLVDFT